MVLAWILGKRQIFSPDPTRKKTTMASSKYRTYLISTWLPGFLMRMRWLDGNTYSMDMNRANSRRQWRSGKPDLLQFIGSQSRTWLSDWTTQERSWVTEPEGREWERNEILSHLAHHFQSDISHSTASSSSYWNGQNLYCLLREMYVLWTFILVCHSANIFLVQISNLYDV